MNFRTSQKWSHDTEGAPSIFRPQLTSLIDVMTFLLVFLIKSFSVEGNLVTPAANLELPVSVTQTPPKPESSIEISKQNITADGKILATIPQVMAGDSLMIPGIYRWVKAQPVFKNTKALAGEATPGILIQADRDVEYSVLKKVMYSCSKAGVVDFSVLAVQKE